MTSRIARIAALLSAITLVPSCARILHPERVGNRSGTVDVVPLVVDILLFIPGVIPGVIAIVVDFGTGAIYVQNSSADSVSDVGRLALRTNDDGTSVIELRSHDGTLIATKPIDQNTAQQQMTVELDVAPTQYASSAIAPGPLK